MKNDYYPFGMLQPGRKYEAATLSGAEGYRYGFNGKENDNEVKGEGNSQDYGMRIYDPRLGRFLSVDPIAKEYPELTPYQFASNTPMRAVDLDGLEAAVQYPDGTLYCPRGCDRLGFKYPAGGRLIGVPHLQTSTAGKIFYRGLGGVVKSLGKAYVAIIHPWQTLKNIGDFADEVIVGSAPGVKSKTPIIDSKVQEFKDQVINGDAGTRSEYFAELGTDLFLAKGTENAFTVTKGMVLAERINARTNFARSFYEKAGFSSAKALEHMEGIDFTKPVTNTTLKKGTIIQQWVGEKGVGDYFTNIENGAEQNLGMPNGYGNRTLKQFVLNEDVRVLKSTAADYKGQAGGGLQYFSNELKSKITEIK